MNLALRQLQDFMSGHHVLKLRDNVATKAHIYQQRGTHSRSLMKEAKQLGLWMERHLSLRAEHISGVSNVQADWLGRAKVDQSE